MRVAIASRIFGPEPSAASFRLGALAHAFSREGVQVRVLTTTLPKALGARESFVTEYRVARFPVLRDKSGYVRGYLQYMSFDIPLFFRILFGPKQDAIVVEPPPTTLFFATLAARLRRTPVFAYAADVWSDASESTGAPSLVVSVVRWMERFGWGRAKGVYSVNGGVTDRVLDIAPCAVVMTVGNGVDTDIFTPDAPAEEPPFHGPYAIYTGTASEWQGAEVFIEAVAELQSKNIDLQLVFLGQGTAFPTLKTLANDSQAQVAFYDSVPPERAAQWLRGAEMSLASIRPGAGYDFAFPTKVYAAWACGTPVVYAGPGPARDVLITEPELGIGAQHDSSDVADAMIDLLSRRDVTARAQIAKWAQLNVSLAGVAQQAVGFTRKQLLG